MQRTQDGWFTIELPGVAVDTRYRFRIDNDKEVADPASCFQPEDVLGPSQLLSPNSYEWKTNDWKGRPWEESVIVEAHVGTFTPEGTFSAMIERLDHLVETGYTVLELMPLAEFPGAYNWGYDGVLWYAPDSSYGHPDDLKHLIDEAHKRGLMVFLDVVYNHFGPEGNFLHAYWPSFFASDELTPWGSAIDFSDSQVRAFIIENAMHWLRHYRFDGLRLDAVQQIITGGDTSLLRDLSKKVGEFAEESGRSIHLVVENDDNTASLLDPEPRVPSGCYRAQWNDDYHHAMHVVLTGETGGYYGDYSDKPLRHIARALASGFAYQGEASAYRENAPRGEPSGSLPPTAFVHFIQNHDQIGNRAYGERLTALCEPAAVAAALALTLLSPQIPLMFMGDEWGSRQPFPFFCDFADDLASAIRDGRSREFSAHFSSGDADIPDPFDPATCRSAILDWDNAARAHGLAHQQMVRDLLTVRREHIAPRLRGARFGNVEAHDEFGLNCTFHLQGGLRLRLLSNLSDHSLQAYYPATTASPLWDGATHDGVVPWSTHAWLEVL